MANIKSRLERLENSTEDKPVNIFSEVITQILDEEDYEPPTVAELESAQNFIKKLNRRNRNEEA
jgi:hypothetical protein